MSEITWAEAFDLAQLLKDVGIRVKELQQDGRDFKIGQVLGSLVTEIETFRARHDI